MYSKGESKIHSGNAHCQTGEAAAAQPFSEPETFETRPLRTRRLLTEKGTPMDPQVAGIASSQAASAEEISALQVLPFRSWARWGGSVQPNNAKLALVLYFSEITGFV